MEPGRDELDQPEQVGDRVRLEAGSGVIPSCVIGRVTGLHAQCEQLAGKSESALADKVWRDFVEQAFQKLARSFGHAEAYVWWWRD